MECCLNNIYIKLYHTGRHGFPYKTLNDYHCVLLSNKGRIYQRWVQKPRVIGWNIRYTHGIIDIWMYRFWIIRHSATNQCIDPPPGGMAYTRVQFRTHSYAVVCAQSELYRSKPDQVIICEFEQLRWAGEPPRNVRSDKMHRRNVKYNFVYPYTLAVPDLPPYNNLKSI